MARRRERIERSRGQKSYIPNEEGESARAWTAWQSQRLISRLQLAWPSTPLFALSPSRTLCLTVAEPAESTVRLDTVRPARLRPVPSGPPLSRQSDSSAHRHSTRAHVDSSLLAVALRRHRQSLSITSNRRVLVLEHTQAAATRLKAALAPLAAAPLSLSPRP